MGFKIRLKIFMAMKAWKDLCKPKDIGGLGFQSFKDINMAFLSNLAWKMAWQEDSLQIWMLSSKYLRGHTFFIHKLKKRSFQVWQVISERKGLRGEVCYKIGNGHSISLWANPWISSLPYCIPRPS